jgi:hypothetical protein
MSNVIDLASRRIKSKDDVKLTWRPEILSANIVLPDVVGDLETFDCEIWQRKEGDPWTWLIKTTLEGETEPVNYDQGEAPTMEEAQVAVLNFLKEQLYWL